MADKNEMKRRIEEDEDYIRCPKFNNSLTRFLNRFSEGVDNSVIARVLMIDEKEVEKAYEDAIKELKEEMDS